MDGGLSLRARLLAGLAAVVVVLVGAAFAVTSLIRGHLLDQVDANLERAIGEGGNERPGANGPQASRYYEATWVTTGCQQLLVRPYGDHRPELTLETVTESARTREPFTVDSVGGSPTEWRALAMAGRNGVRVVA